MSTAGLDLKRPTLSVPFFPAFLPRPLRNPAVPQVIQEVNPGPRHCRRIMAESVQCLMVGEWAAGLAEAVKSHSAQIQIRL